MDFSDQELVSEIRSGSAIAFERLMNRHQNLVYRVAYGYTGDRESALDVTQETFLKVHTRLRSFRGTGEVKSWIVRIATNEARNRGRTERRHPTLALDEASFRDPAPSAEETRVRESRERALERSLATLRPRHRLAVVLRYYGNLSPREIAPLLECSEARARNMLFRSLKKLRSVLTENEEYVR